MGKRLRDEAMRLAIDDTTMHYRTRYALVTLADKMDDRHMTLFTSDSRAAEMLGMSRHAFMRARAELIHRGYMVRVAGPGPGSRKNRYGLLPWLEQGCDGTKSNGDPCDFKGCDMRGKRTGRNMSQTVTRHESCAVSARELCGKCTGTCAVSAHRTGREP